MVISILPSSIASYCSGGGILSDEFGKILIERSGTRFFTSAASTRAARWRASLSGSWCDSRNSRASAGPAAINSTSPSVRTAQITQRNGLVDIPQPLVDGCITPRHTAHKDPDAVLTMVTGRGLWKRKRRIEAKRRLTRTPRADHAPTYAVRLCRRRLRRNRIVVQHRRQPALALGNGPALAPRIIGNLVALDFADAKVVAVGMREIQA